MPHRPRAQAPSLAVGTAACPAFTPPRPRPGPADDCRRTRRVQNIVPAKPRPPPPLFITVCCYSLLHQRAVLPHTLAFHGRVEASVFLCVVTELLRPLKNCYQSEKRAFSSRDGIAARSVRRMASLKRVAELRLCLRSPQVPSPPHSGAVLIAPSCLPAEATPPSNVVIGPGDITQGCRLISAEQKRRFSINAGFRTLCSLVPTLKTKSSSKPQVTNAATLQKTVEYIGKLQQERQQMQEETRSLREEIEELNASISSCHQKLPATGAPVTRHRLDYMWDKFNAYVRTRTVQNWKFWIFSIIIKPLFESFNSTVSTASVLELHQTTLRWLEQHCSLLALRPMVLDALLQLSTSSSILTHPSRLPEEACRAVGHAPGNRGES
ncbi:hypothetical protein SKAU_G00354570 [Synaphobranchus kaupii]|uniref:BHLH domain-containing protein n=1 Tax=Synaphobranchus kaupii TaxID=118154 RepID=A0A9Q1IGG9_SYNKA|nr:hypothetical protein SKAU_G00354570 [Synaphobranchus kaupii]